jgi:hypothetical protein
MKLDYIIKLYYQTGSTKQEIESLTTIVVITIQPAGSHVRTVGKTLRNSISILLHEPEMECLPSIYAIIQLSSSRGVEYHIDMVRLAVEEARL